MQLNSSFILLRTWYMAWGYTDEPENASAFIWSIMLPSPSYDITRPKHKLNKRYTCTLNLLFYGQHRVKRSSVCKPCLPYTHPTLPGLIPLQVKVSLSGGAAVHTFNFHHCGQDTDMKNLPHSAPWQPLLAPAPLSHPSNHKSLLQQHNSVILRKLHMWNHIVWECSF